MTDCASPPLRSPLSPHVAEPFFPFPFTAILDLFPTASVFYLGLFREKVSLQPVEYYQKLPPTPTVDTLFLLDPLVATGGTAVAAVSMLVSSSPSPSPTRK